MLRSIRSKRLVEPADFLEREGVNRLEPPVVGEMRTQRLEEFDLLGLAALPAAEAYEAEHAGRRRRNHGVARMQGEMRARRRQCLDRLALDGKAKRVDMALLARRGGGRELAGTRRRLPCAGDVGHQETRPRQRRMGQREAGIGLDGLRELRRVAVRSRQHAVAPGDVGGARGLGRRADRQPVSVGEHDGVSPGCTVEHR